MNRCHDKVRGGLRALLFCLALLIGTFPAVALVDSATLLSNSIPEGTLVMPKTTFTQTWTFQNTGTSTWSPGQTNYTLNIVGKDSLGVLPNFTNTHSAWYIPSAIINSGQSIVHGGHASYSLTFIAPETPGAFTDTFQLSNG